MNTIELIKILKKNKITRDNFQGVFPCDKLPKIIHKPAIIIANTDDSHKNGTHWVAFYVSRNNIGEYFSSYGDFPRNKYFLKFLFNNSTSFVNNEIRLQSDFSSTCGYYCCVYLYYKCKGKSLRQFLKLFSLSDYEGNDRKVMKLYHKYFGEQFGGNSNQINQICCQRSYKRRSV